MKKALAAALTLLVSAATLCIGASGSANAENPIVQTSFTPDPAPVVFGDELYVFTGCDREGNNDFYYMTGWQCFSTKDMKNWTDHGRILEDTSFSWAGKNDAWASQCIERNGKYYFYFTTTNNTGGGRAIGVGVADSPEGPYKDVLGKPLCGPNWDYIDPTVIIDDDGQAWLMFGNPKCYYVKLKEDMVTLDGPIQTFNLSLKSGTKYTEGPWIYKHDSLYYLVFASMVDGFGGESISYCTGPTVTGPWTHQGTIHEGSNCFTTHGGIIDYKDHSYSFYHMNGLSGGGSFNRSAACEEFTYNPDGTIPALKSTKNGPDQIEALNPFERVEAETICWCEGVKTEKDENNSVCIGNIKKGSYIKVSGVDFSTGADTFTACAASAESGGNIELHLDSKNGPIVGNLKVGATGGWHNWEEYSCSVSGAEGEHDLYLVFNGGDGFLMNVDWWQFGGAGSASSGTGDGYIFKSTYENSTDGWSGRGGASVTKSDAESLNGSGSVYVSERTAAWNGIVKSLNYKFKAGESYSFSTNVKYTEGADLTQFHLTLQYDDASGDTYYEKIDSQNVEKGKWTQLANTSFTIPTGAKNCYVYVETGEDENVESISFYVDDFMAAADGTEIPGAGKSNVSISITPGDLNDDGYINAFDLILARRTLVNRLAGKTTDAAMTKAADVDRSGDYTVADLVQIANYILGRTKSFDPDPLTTFPVNTTTTTTSATTINTLQAGNYMAQISNGIQIKEDSSMTSRKAGVDYGTVEKKTYYSKDAGMNKTMNVLLPPGYSTSEKYPVLYVLHGIFGDENSMLDDGMKIQTMLGNLIAAGEAEKMIVVFPQMFTSSTATPAFTAESSRAYDAIREDIENSIMPYLEENYSVKTGRENTAITGFSMGGREALYTGITHSDVYGYVGGACSAPGIFATQDANMVHEGCLQPSQFKPGTAPYLILISAAQFDGVVNNYPQTYHEALEANGVDHIWQVIPDGDHGGNTVRPHMYNFLRYIFKAA